MHTSKNKAPTCSFYGCNKAAHDYVGGDLWCAAHAKQARKIFRSPSHRTRNPFDPEYTRLLGGGAFSTAMARDVDPHGAEALTKTYSIGGAKTKNMDFTKVVLILTRAAFANNSKALAYLPAIEPRRIDYNPADGKPELIYTMPVYKAWRDHAHNATALATALYRALERSVTGQGSLESAARNFESAAKRSPLCVPEIPVIKSILLKMHEIIKTLPVVLYQADMHGGNFAMNNAGHLILLDPVVAELHWPEAEKFWLSQGWPVVSKAKTAPVAPVQPPRAQTVPVVKPPKAKAINSVQALHDQFLKKIVEQRKLQARDSRWTKTMKLLAQRAIDGMGSRANGNTPADFQKYQDQIVIHFQRALHYSSIIWVLTEAKARAAAVKSVAKPKTAPVAPLAPAGTVQELHNQFIAKLYEARRANGEGAHWLVNMLQEADQVAARVGSHMHRSGPRDFRLYAEALSFVFNHNNNTGSRRVFATPAVQWAYNQANARGKILSAKPPPVKPKTAPAAAPAGSVLALHLRFMADAEKEGDGAMFREAIVFNRKLDLAKLLSTERTAFRKYALALAGTFASTGLAPNLSFGYAPAQWAYDDAKKAENRAATVAKPASRNKPKTATVIPAAHYAPDSVGALHEKLLTKIREYHQKNKGLLPVGWLMTALANADKQAGAVGVPCLRGATADNFKFYLNVLALHYPNTFLKPETPEGWVYAHAYFIAYPQVAPRPATPRPKTVPAPKPPPKFNLHGRQFGLFANPRRNPAPDIASIIAQQLGGTRRLTAMIGAKYFMSYPPRYEESPTSLGGLVFRFPNPNRSKANCVKIFLMPDDTYSVHFIRLGGAAAHSYKRLAVFNDIYAEDLKRLIEGETNLRLSL